MKKRYIGVLHINEDGEGVIELVGEEDTSSLQKMGVQHKQRMLEKSPSMGGYS